MGVESLSVRQSLRRPEKGIVRFPHWPDPEEGAGYIWFDALLDVRGVTEQGVVLDGRC